MDPNPARVPGNATSVVLGTRATVTYTDSCNTLPLNGDHRGTQVIRFVSDNGLQPDLQRLVPAVSIP